MQSFGYNKSKCYDDYLCDQPGTSGPNHGILGFTCFILCLYGIVSNLVLLPAYNIGLNRSGATVYLSAMSIFDVTYMVVSLLMVVSRYMSADFPTQMETYAQFSARFVPIGSPILLFCELTVVSPSLLPDLLYHVGSSEAGLECSVRGGDFPAFVIIEDLRLKSQNMLTFNIPLPIKSKLH